MGVERLDLDQVNVRMVARTLPGKQFEVGRDLRARVVLAFRRQGLTLPTPQEGGYSSTGTPPSPAGQPTPQSGAGSAPQPVTGPATGPITAVLPPDGERRAPTPSRGDGGR
jgi:hypothetical protein